MRQYLNLALAKLVVCGFHEILDLAVELAGIKLLSMLFYYLRIKFGRFKFNYGINQVFPALFAK